MEIDVSKCICRTFEENGIKKIWYSREYVQQLKSMIGKIKEHCNETIRVMGDTGNNPYAQGRTIEAIRVLEILGEYNGN